MENTTMQSIKSGVRNNTRHTTIPLKKKKKKGKDKRKKKKKKQEY